MSYIYEDWSFLHVGEFNLMKALYKQEKLDESEYLSIVELSAKELQELSDLTDIDTDYKKRLVNLKDPVPIDWLETFGLLKVDNEKIEITKHGKIFSRFLFQEIPDYRLSTLMLGFLGKRKNIFANKPQYGNAHFLAGVQGLNMKGFMNIAKELENENLVKKGLYDFNAITRSVHIEITSEAEAIVEEETAEKKSKLYFKQIILKKIDSILNSSIEKKITYGMFVAGIALITAPLLNNYLVFKGIFKGIDISLSIGDTDGIIQWVSLVFGGILISVSVYLLMNTSVRNK